LGQTWSGSDLARRLPDQRIKSFRVACRREGSVERTRGRTEIAAGVNESGCRIIQWLLKGGVTVSAWITGSILRVFRLPPIEQRIHAPERGPEPREPGGIIGGLADGAVTMLGKVLGVFARMFEPAAVLDSDRSNTDREPMP